MKNDNVCGQAHVGHKAFTQKRNALNSFNGRARVLLTYLSADVDIGHFVVPLGCFLICKDQYLKCKIANNFFFKSQQ
jgi:hypothetical protein